MAPPHRSNNRTHRDDQNRGRSRTARGQTGGSQDAELDAAMERQRQAQREVARLQNRAGPPTSGRRGSQSQSRSHRAPSVASNRNRSVANNRNTSALRQASRPTGVTKHQQAPRTGLGLPLEIVPEAERRDFVNPRHGTGGMVVINKTLGGGEQSRFGAVTNTRGLMGATHETNDLKAVGDHVMMVNQCDQVSFHIEPRRNDAKSFMENEEVLVRVTSSTGRTRQGKVAALGEPSRISEISRQRGSECVNCKSKTHTLLHCLDAENEDRIFGCVICNKDNHLVDECRQFRDMSLKQQVEVLVFGRANMPRLDVSKAFPHWSDLLERAISSGDVDPNEPMKGFPWTGRFCSEICHENRGDTIKALQDRFDDSGFDPSILPVDPDTDGLDSVRQYYPVQPQTSGAPGPSSSGDHIHPDDPKDLPHAAEGRFPALTPRADQPASWASEVESTAPSRIFRRL